MFCVEKRLGKLHWEFPKKGAMIAPSPMKEEDNPMAIDYAKNYQNYIDEELAAASATEWMAATSGQVR